MCFQQPKPQAPIYVTSPSPAPSASTPSASPVTKDNAKVQRQQEIDRFRRRSSTRGLANTIFTSGLGDTSEPTVRKTKLGA